jgi:hypothetical protein
LYAFIFSPMRATCFARVSPSFDKPIPQRKKTNYKVALCANFFFSYSRYVFSLRYEYSPRLAYFVLRHWYLRYYIQVRDQVSLE